MKKYDVITIGDAFEDVFVWPEINVKYDRSFGSGKGICFEFGEKIPLQNAQYEVGGSACNVSVGLSRLGYESVIATILGDDTPKEKVVERLDAENVSTDCLVISPKQKTGFSVIFAVEDDRTIFVYHGVKDYADLKIRKDVSAKWLFVSSLGQNTKSIEERIVEEVSVHGAKFAWNPGSTQINEGANRYKHLLYCTDILFLNREEVIKFINYPIRPQIEEAIKKLHSYGAKLVVMTDGSKGAMVYDGKEFYHAAADQRLKRVDATGAGDAFATGFLGRLIDSDMLNLEEKEIREALAWGIKNSASVIQKVGAQPGLLTKSNISVN
jgi:fructokinase